MSYYSQHQLSLAMVASATTQMADVTAVPVISHPAITSHVIRTSGTADTGGNMHAGTDFMKMELFSHADNVLGAQSNLHPSLCHAQLATSLPQPYGFSGGFADLQMQEIKAGYERKRNQRMESVPQSGFKGVSWNSRMKAWLAFYVNENGERRSKTFSTRKLGMEDARLQAISFCKEKQTTRRQARKKLRGQSNKEDTNDKISSDESATGESPRDAMFQLGTKVEKTRLRDASQSYSHQSHISDADVAYVPIIPIQLDTVIKSGILGPLELNMLPPCQHCQKQPYPFLMIVAEGQENSYKGAGITHFTQEKQQQECETSCRDKIVTGSPLSQTKVVIPKRCSSKTEIPGS